MIDRIENKFIDSMGYINVHEIQGMFSCTMDEAGEILQNYFNKRKVIEGSLDLSRSTNLVDLGSVRTVSGSLIINNSSLQDLGNLRMVNGTLQILATPIVDTGKLVYCEGLYISTRSFVEFKRLGEVNGNVRLIDTSLKDLGSLKDIGGDLFMLSNPDLNSLNRLVRVIGDVCIADCPQLPSLDKLESIGGSLDMRDSSIGNLGILNSIGGFVIAKRSKMNGFDANKKASIDLTPLSTMFNKFPKSFILNIPKLNQLENFNLMVIDDIDEEPF